MKVFNFFAVGFCLLAPVATKVVQIDPSSQQYVDKEGRVKVFHGKLHQIFFYFFFFFFF